MNLFHRHRWLEVTRKSVPGILETKRAFEAEGGIPDDLLFGYTVIEECCAGCHKTRIERYSGSVR